MKMEKSKSAVKDVGIELLYIWKESRGRIFNGETVSSVKIFRYKLNQYCRENIEEVSLAENNTICTLFEVIHQDILR